VWRRFEIGVSHMGGQNLKMTEEDNKCNDTTWMNQIRGNCHRVI
jgi:hypothetical protein